MNIRGFSISTRIVVLLMLIGTGVFVAYHADTPTPDSTSSDTGKDVNLSSWFTPQTTPIYMFLIALAIFLFKYASKEEVKSMKEDLQGSIKSLKNDLEGDIESLKSDIKDDISRIDRRLDTSDQNHLRHIEYHPPSPDSQKGEDTEDEHRARTRPGTPQGDRSKTQ